MHDIQRQKGLRNIPYYDKDVDFDKLATQDADWATLSKSAKQRHWVDFQDPKVVLQLTRSILKCDFNLTLSLPDDRLCPPVPVRWNYVHWIQDLLDTTSQDYSESYDAQREVFGLDVGAGASAIYPLLACSTRPTWKMIGTDIDQTSLDYARKNVDANDLQPNIKAVLSTADSPLIPLDKLRVEGLDFMMTNPPFYSSKADMLASYTNKEAPASAVCTGSENEMICLDGDLGFVARIIDESLILRERVQWYTAMLGKFSSLHQVIDKLKEQGINNFAVTCLQAGHRTNRWAVGWSFRDLRPRNEIARHGKLVLGILPQVTEQSILLLPHMNGRSTAELVNCKLRELDVKWEWQPSISTGVLETQGNVWSRAARRKKLFGARHGQTQDTDVVERKEASEREEISGVALAVKIVCEEEAIHVRWLRGMDFILFESFYGFLKRAVSTKLE